MYSEEWKGAIRIGQADYRKRFINIDDYNSTGQSKDLNATTVSQNLETNARPFQNEHACPPK